VDGGSITSPTAARLGTFPGFAFNSDYIRLARTLDEAIGFIHDNGTPGDPDDDFYVGPSVMDLQRDVNNTDVHSLRAERNEALDGLTEGRVYFVVGSDYGGGVTREPNTSCATSGGAISFDNDGISGGTHRFTIDGVDLTGSAASP
jgi:hypothetical protein